MSLRVGPKLMTCLSILLVILLIEVNVLEAKCPSKEYSWCLQIDGYDNVLLDGNRWMHPKTVLSHISNLLEGNKEGKNFDQFFLYNNQEVLKLEANTFSDLKFSRVSIKNCTKLIRIDPLFFNGTQHLITKVHIDLISISGPKNIDDFFEALNSLPKLEELELLNHNIITIPSRAFRQPALNRLELDGPLDIINTNAFFDLDSLRIIKLFKSVKHIPSHSFDFKTPTNKTLDIYFDIKFHTIESGIFLHTLRPITLNLYLKKLRDFSDIVFKPILESNIRHDIIFHGELKEMIEKCIIFWLFDENDTFKGKFSFKTDPMISAKDFEDCHDNSINDSQVNSSVNSYQPINSIPYCQLLDKYLILFVGSLFSLNYLI